MSDRSHARVRNSEGDRLQVLLAEYETLRGEGSSFTTAVATLASVAAALIAAAGAILVQTCPDVGGCTDKTTIPSYWYAFLPLPPLLLFTFGVMLGATQTIRSYYLRALERQLSAFGQRVKLPAGVTLPQPMFSHLELAIGSPPRALRAFRIALVILMLGMISVVVATTGSAVSRVHPVEAAVASAAAYLVVLVLLGRMAILAGIRGHRLWIRSTEAGLSAWERPLGEREKRKGRSFASYLFLPRPLDVIKFTFAPAGFFIGFGSVFGVWRFSAWEIVAFIATLEFVVYQGRYIVNDLRDRKIDWALGVIDRFPPSAELREDLHVALAVLSLLVRAGAWIAIALALGGSLQWGLLISGSAVATLAVAYELTRNRTRRVQKPHITPSATDYSVYLLVGVGYGIRLIAGLWLGFGGHLRTSALLLTLLAGTALGVMFVTMTWALQGMSFDDRSISSKELELKSHYAPLLAQAAQIDEASATDVDDPKRRRILIDPTCGDSIWDVAFIASAVIGTWLALSLSGATRIDRSWLIMVGAAAMVSAVAILQTNLRPALGAVLLLSGAGLLLALGVRADISRPLELPIPFLLAGSVYLTFRSMCFDNTRLDIRRVMLGMVCGLIGALSRIAPAAPAHRETIDLS